MSTFCDDNSHFGEFTNDHDAEISYVDWPPDPTAVVLRRCTGRDLIQRQEPQMRVIFAPLDLPHHSGLRPLFGHYDIPADFLAERLFAVTNAYGTRTLDDGSHCSWFHYLCKSINIRETPDSRPEIFDLHPDNVILNHLPHDNWVWLRAAFFLKWNDPPIPPPNCSQAKISCVTLICFGASEAMEGRFISLGSHPKWSQAVKNPYNLFVIVLDHLFREMTQQTWNLATVFRDIELRTMMRARDTADTKPYDFVGLHIVAKHCTFLIEAFNAILRTLERMRTDHANRFASAAATQAMLEYKVGLFQSTKLRLASMDSRTKNIIALSFNLVTQRDSRVMLKDSDSMNTIAILTMIFLPATTVATVFGSQFFDFDPNVDPPAFRVSARFWIFWAISLPLTVIALAMWQIIHQRKNNALRGDVGNFLWKRLRHRLSL